MPISPIDEIKNRLDIVEVIGSYIKLKRAGANYKALCPFHSEKNPSFFVSPARQIWHCFGCGLGGSIFDFVMKIEGVEFGDALRILAQRAGVELKPQDPRLKTERKRLYEICELATKFFERQFKGKTGNKVKEYLKKRGITEDSIKKWRLGWAPESWRGLYEFLISKGYRGKEILKAGLAIRNEKGTIYDRFRGRIMFPIFDLNSQVIGFGGRVFGSEKEVAKYINTPNTLLYDKSKILYGLDKAKIDIRKKNSCILTEGYTDVILAHQHGFTNTVSTSGTALTNYQLKILKRYTDTIFTAFDMDIAGESATKRGIDLAQRLGFNIKVILLPEGKDPADVISENPKLFEGLKSNAKGILEFYFESAFLGRDAAKPEGKKEISNILLPVLKRISNRIVRSFWIQKLAKKLGVREEDVREELKKVRLDEEKFGLETEEIVKLPQKSRKELLEERLITIGLRHSDFFDLISEKDYEFFSPKIGRLLTFLKAKKEIPKDLSGIFNSLALKSEIEAEEVREEAEKDFKDCLKEIKRLGIKNKLNEISQKIKKAEEEKNLKRTKDLIEKFNYWTKKIQKI